MSSRLNISEEFETEECHVFLNFRGKDTRRGFINTLSAFFQFKERNIRVFLDEKKIKVGNEIAERIKRAITDSQIYICVFSRNYASSPWCLRELAFMLESRRKSNGKEILPIFYNVKVEDVKLKTDLYRDHLSELKKEYGEETVQKWEKALKEIAAIKGWDSADYGGDADLSEVVVGEVRSRLKIQQMRGHLVGLKEAIDNVIAKLDIESGGVKFLAIHGVSGVGKTSLAKSVFHQLSVRFQGCSFLADIQESFEHGNGFEALKEQLLRDIPDSDGESTSIEKRFRDKKVLIVLDNVNKREQVMEFAKKSLRFGPGSRIIITTAKDHPILLIQPAAGKKSTEGAAKKFKEFDTLEMKEMEFDQALRLFSKYAFCKDSPPDDHRSLSEQAVESVGPLIPLTIEIIGSFLRGKNEEVWNRTFLELKEIHSHAINLKLKVIYDALSYQAKQIFLDIACLFVNKEKTNAMYTWEACHNNREGIDVLTGMSMVKILDDGKLWMHDYLRDLGRGIVDADRWKNPGVLTRLWRHNEALEVLQRYEGKQNVEALCLCYDPSLRGLTLTHKEFTNLKVLRFLKLYSVKLSGDLEHLLPRLRWLSWHECPHEFEATNLLLRKLVILDLSESLIMDKWGGWSCLQGAIILKVLDLTGCRHLERTPNLSKFKYLERMILAGCTRLVEIDSSIVEMKRLKYLNLRGCDSLMELPEQIGSLEALSEIIFMQGECKPFNLPESIGSSKSMSILEVGNVGISQLPLSKGGLGRLERLSLFRCSMIKQLPDSLGGLSQLIELDVSETGIIAFPASIGDLKELKVIKMSRCPITELPRAIGMAQNLKELHADHCTELRGEVPAEIGNLSHLKILDLSYTGITTLPETISQLSELEILHLESCHNLERLPKLPQGLTRLHFELWSLLEDPILCELGNLVDLVMSDIGPDLPSQGHISNLEWMQTLSKLENLDLSVSDSSTFCLPQLKSLNLSCRDLSKACSELPCTLSRLVLAHLEVHSRLPHFENLENLSFLSFYRCSIKEKDGLELGQLKSLFHFSAIECLFRMGKGLCLPKDLRVLSMSECEFCADTFLDLAGLKHLKQLKLSKCKGLIEVRGVGQLESLQELIVRHCECLARLDDLSNLRKLEIVKIYDCEMLTYVGDLERISELDLKEKFIFLNCRPVKGSCDEQSS
ncbi:TMV resistance protein N-like isoform X1 [Punica granatum]|uniref:TMV resistance protein N-like isoform X1 n=1 Tax=Punica granatum TaxID=22663 RepID=A0A6P8BQP5_PUNGR|nr:TMV resistance protein N-like isoform X1 [Punica granatum]